MKIEYVNGCMCDTLNVDGVETIDMKLEDVKNIVKKLIDKEEDLAVIQDLLTNLLESQGKYEDLGHCDCCGDWITKYEIEI